jgi:hypothetical protein
VRRRLTDVIHDATDPLGFTPALRFDGPLDALVPDDIAADLIAVVREALSNTARSGLANLRTRAEKHNGTLTIDSSAGRGTTLMRTAPLPEPAQDDNARQAPCLPAVSNDPDLAGRQAVADRFSTRSLLVGRP